MNKVTVLLIVIAVVGILISVFSFGRLRRSGDKHPSRDQAAVTNLPSTQAMKITSTAFSHNQNIPAKYTCDGEDVNPPLLFSEIPEGTKNLALIVDDPDAPGRSWVHWVVYNIDSSTATIGEDSVPTGALLGTTDFGTAKYGGPCPPSGTHRYFFKLYALDMVLDLAGEPTKDNLEEAMEGHILDAAELVGLYSRT